MDSDRPTPPLPDAPRRVLLAEDDPIAQLTVRRLLEKRGYVVVAVGNGQDVLAAHAREPFDVVLMDVQMPLMGGWEATVAIREREREQGGHVPIIALTASSGQGDRESCLAGGMDGFLSKPVSPEQLIAEIDALIRSDSSGR